MAALLDRRMPSGAALVLPALFLVAAFLLAPLALIFRYKIGRAHV